MGYLYGANVLVSASCAHDQVQLVRERPKENVMVTQNIGTIIGKKPYKARTLITYGWFECTFIRDNETSEHNGYDLVILIFNQIAIWFFEN